MDTVAAKPAYRVEIKGRHESLGLIFATAHNHPEFSHRTQDLVLSMPGGCLPDIDVYLRLTEAQWAMSDSELSEHLKTVL